MRNLRRQLLLTDPLTTVEKLTNKSILTKSSDDTGKCNTYVLNSKLTKRFSKIKDFVEKFFSDEDLKLNALIIDYSLGYITEEQARELINIINNNINKQDLEYFIKLKNFTGFTDVNLLLTKDANPEIAENIVHYDTYLDGLRGSNFNSVTIKLYNNSRISVLQNMFRGATCKTITFDLSKYTNQGISAVQPTDMSGWCEWNNALVNHPNNIDYSTCQNIGYAWEWCNSLQEIPSYYTVTDETSRLNTVENIVGGSTPFGIFFANQAFNICRNLRKVGPVLNFLGVVPVNNIYHQPSSMFNDSNNITDIRLLNLCNGDWSFIYYDYRGLSNLDTASIKYCINNLAKQSKILFTNQVTSNISEPTYGLTNLLQNSNTSLLLRNYLSDFTMFWNIVGTYKINLPTGITAKLVWCSSDQNNNYNMVYNIKTEIVGNGTLQTFTNDLEDYKYCLVELYNTDGTALTKDIMQEYMLNNTFEFYVGNSTDNYFLPVRHTLYFDGWSSSKILNNITKEEINTANSKGWTVRVGNVVNKEISSGEVTSDMLELTESDFTIIDSATLTNYVGRPKHNSNTWQNTGNGDTHKAIDISSYKVIKIVPDSMQNMQGWVTFAKNYETSNKADGDELIKYFEIINFTSEVSYIKPDNVNWLILTTGKESDCYCEYKIYLK